MAKDKRRQLKDKMSGILMVKTNTSSILMITFFTQKVGKMTLFGPDERKTQPKTSLYLSQQNSEIIWFSLVFKK